MQFSLIGHVCLQTKLDLWKWSGYRHGRGKGPPVQPRKPVHQLLKQHSSTVPVRGLSPSLCLTIYYALSPETHWAPNQPTAQLSVSLGAKPQQSYQKQVPVRQSWMWKGQNTFPARGPLSSKLNLDWGVAWYLGDLKQKYREFTGSGGLEWDWVKMMVEFFQCKYSYLWQSVPVSSA